MEEGGLRPWSGQVLTLGRQLTAVAADAFVPLARELGYVPRSWKNPGDRHGVLSDLELFEGLGFDRLLALDANAYEKPDVVHDLNHAEIPLDLAGQFDLVFDGGTLEHVFDVANALRTVCRFTKSGGRVVHVSPLSNCVDHGFYSFSPTLFVDFYTANNWIIRRLAVARFDRDPAGDPWEMRDYRPQDFAQLGALPAGTYFLLTCVESRSDSTFEVVPQQSYYGQVWDDGQAIHADG
jgi:SAM-dependent methyltransferase